MNTRVPILAARGAALAAAVAAAGFSAAALAKAKSAEDILAKYEKTGETASCLSLTSIRETDIVDDYAMLVSASGETYLNEMRGRCIGLKNESRFSHDAVTGKMCSGDIIRVLDSFGGYRGSCALGEFEKLKEIPAPADAS